MSYRRKVVSILLVVMLLVSLAASMVGVQAATDTEIETAIDDGLAYLASVQNADGSWSIPSYLPAKTCMILVKFQDRAYELGYDSPFDPAYMYQQNVIDGWTYVFSDTIVLTETMNVQPAGDPDTNGNGYGLYVYGEASHYTYATGVCLMALAASRTPAHENEGGLDFNGDMSPDTYLEIAQEFTDWLAMAQSDADPTGAPSVFQGGWNYDAQDNQYDDADQSNAGFAVLGLSYGWAFGINIPVWVSTELDIWIDEIQDDATGCSHYGPADSWFNVYKQGHLLNMLLFVGDDPATSTRVDDAISCAESYWMDSSVDPGWGYNLGSTANYLGMYSVMKGFGYAGYDLIDTDGDGVRDDDWYNQEPPKSPADDFATVLVAQQNADGSWPDDCNWGYEYEMCTLWALFTLEKTFPEPPAVNISATKADDPDPVQPGATLTYDVVVENEGLVDSAGVVMTDTLPAEVTYVSDDGGCTHAAGEVVCDLGAMAAGDVANIEIVVTVDTDFIGTMTNTVEAWPIEDDSDPTNNTWDETTEVEYGYYYIPDVEHLADSISSIQVVNIGTEIAEITIYYYDMLGTLVTEIDDTVDPSGSKTYLPIHPAVGFDGSAIIEYTGEVAALANFNYLDPLTASSYHGFPEGNGDLVFPLIMKDNNFNDTTFNVQNVTGSPVDILIEFIPEPGAGYDDTIPDIADTLPAWSAHGYDQRTLAGFAGVGKWVGSASVTVVGEGDIVGVAQQIDSERDTATAYTAFLQGAMVVDLPLIMDNNNSMWTSINCQNLGPGATDVTVDYFPETGYVAKASESALAVAEDGTAVFLQSPFVDQWVGAATVTAGNELACVVNQTNLPFGYASGYQGFDSGVASGLIVAPLIQFQDQGDGHNLWTGVNIQNLGTLATTVTLNWLPQPGFADIADMTVDIDPGAVGVILFYDPYGDGSNAVGGGEFNSDNGQPLAVVINQQKVNYTGDVYMTYVGFDK